MESFLVLETNKSWLPDDILLLKIDEWILLCQQILRSHQDKHSWDEKSCLYRIFRNIVDSKYLNASLMKKCIEEILPKFDEDQQHDICKRLCFNPVLTIDMMFQYPEFPWYLIAASEHMNIHDILNHPELQWNWEYVSCNLSVTLEVILSHMEQPWSWSRLSGHPNITMADIESHMDLPWVWDTVGVSRNPNITMTMITRYSEKDWDWRSISSVMKLTVDLLRLNKPWNFSIMSLCNTTITLDILLATPDLPWVFRSLSDNGCLSMEMLLAFPEKDWNWASVSMNARISMADIESHLDLRWEWEAVSVNPNFRIYDIVYISYSEEELEWIEAPIFNPDEYIDDVYCKYSVLGMHEEDYGRGKECLDYKNAVDLVIQDEHSIHEILAYI